jgi:uncharacterized protein YbjT (DUF2867 family)
MSRASGVDVISGAGLTDALNGVDVVIDASNPYPAGGDLAAAFSTAARNVTSACTDNAVQHLVLLSIIGVESSRFDGFPYFVAKRIQADLVAESNVPTTIVKASQFYEFATDPSVVSFTDHAVLVQDWLIQPVAAQAIARRLVEAALARTPGTQMFAGADVVRLPLLTARLLKRRGDPRPVHPVPADMPILSNGGLLAPSGTTIVGPDIATWIAQHATHLEP